MTSADKETKCNYSFERMKLERSTRGPMQQHVGFQLVVFFETSLVLPF